MPEVMTEGAFINGALIGISENRHFFQCEFGDVVCDTFRPGEWVGDRPRQRICRGILCVGPVGPRGPCLRDMPAGQTPF